MRRLLVLPRGVQLAVVRVVLGRQEAALGVRHLAEVVFHELGEVARRLDVVQRAEGGRAPAVRLARIADGGGEVGGGDGGVGAFLSGGDVAGGTLEGGGGVLAFGALVGFALVTEGFGFEAVDLLGGFVSMDGWMARIQYGTYDSFDLFGR